VKFNKDPDLVKAGISDPLHQEILIDCIPCGIETAGEALRDKTSIEVNAPRALMVVEWKGMAKAFATLEGKLRRRKK
jgi:hypothetical protein